MLNPSRFHHGVKGDGKSAAVLKLPLGAVRHALTSAAHCRRVWGTAEYFVIAEFLAGEAVQSVFSKNWSSAFQT
jgi:hypothetical protein